MNAPPAPFVVGVGRSGTTLLRLMLNAHSDLCIPGETHFLPDLFAQDDASTTPAAVRDTIVGSARWENFHLDEAELEARLEALTPFSISQAVREFYKLCAARSNKSRWGDKTPPYRGAMAKIQRHLPEASFIHLIRDGRDVCLSYRGLWFGPGDDVKDQAHFWVRQVLNAREQAKQVSRYMEVKYEDLVQQPESTLKRISDFLDLEYEGSMLNYDQTAEETLSELVAQYRVGSARMVSAEDFMRIHKRTQHKPDPSRIGVWERDMSRKDLKLYEDIAGDLLHGLGYEIGSAS